ncbi:hypothetical protein ACUXAV_000378 [Cupriavidus metallidurans]|uniref:DUF7940 domain-containing protein n=1 Tax=Cupriavidus metallidurans TaxID=119219 RepID=UPI0004930D02|nr:hypothetical protein [Cupriavidus metallidurans]MDE4918338.1 hypothetical protein [Cupriavidus metallidurans]
MKFTLADNWRQLHRKGTVIAGATFTAVMGLGPLLVQAWSAMPPELKAVIPQNVQQWIAYTMFGLTFLALRYTSVRRRDEEKEGGDDPA